MREGEGCYPCFDANENVSEYVNDTGAIVAHYEYDPYGNLIASLGPQAALFTPRFSTKYLDEEVGSYYCGYRYYNPELGRWLNRDPLGDQAFFSSYTRDLTLRETVRLRKESLGPTYLFVQNSPTIHVDPYGLAGLCDTFMPGMPGDDYAWGPGKKCYHRGCLLGACNDLIECVGEVAGGIWGDLGKCLVGCLPALYFGPGAYGDCLAACTGLGTAIECGACPTEYQGRKKDCEVDDCYCK